MKDEIIILIRNWVKSKTGIDLMHDPSLISLVNEIEDLRIHDVVGRSKQFKCHACGTNHSGKNNDRLFEVCEECFDSI